MIYFTAKHYLKAERVDEFLGIMKGLSETTHKNDKGVADYAFYQDVSDPNTLISIEAWESQEDMDAHLNSEHFLSAVSKIGDVYAKPSEFNTYKKLF